MIRVVMKNGNTVNLLVCCDLFIKKLNIIQTVNHMLNVIRSRLGLGMSLCRFVMCERSGTNKKALRELKEKCGDIPIGKHLRALQVWCISHT